MKRLKKTLAVILTLCMMMSCVSVTAFATGTDASEKDQAATEETKVADEENTSDDEASKEAVVSSDSEEENTEVKLEDKWLHPQNSGISTTSAADDFFKIMFLDCGRKYFSVDGIKQIIDNASAAGFNYIQLAVGNDGLRFLLDNMSLTVNGETYNSSAVTSAIQAGNKSYCDFGTNELTQSEMDTIIKYASEKGMGVIPCINSPGHMDAILSAANSLTGTTCSYNESARTIDVTNDTAVQFTRTLIQKYMTYFAGRGCKYFNLGADEYANDKYTSGSMGFGNLQSMGKYSYYVQYVNQMADAVKTNGMTPMAFNDGIYFAGNTSGGEFNTDIIICYWSSGWGWGADAYTPMSVANLAAKGFRIINTHGDYYWVLGKADAQCSADKAKEFDYKSFPGGTIDNPAGAMFCIWSDYPEKETESSVISKTSATIAAFGRTLPAGSNSGETTEPTEKTITVSVGSTKTDTITGKDYSGTHTTGDSSIATVTAERTETKLNEVTTIESGKKYLIFSQRQKALLTNQTIKDWKTDASNCLKLDGTASTSSRDLWTITGSNGRYTVQDASGKYLTIGNDTASVKSTSSNITLSYNSKGYWNISSNSCYLNNLGSSNNAGGWNGNGASTDDGSKWTIYEIVQSGTEVTFSGVAAGTTHVTIGGINYTINVVEPGKLTNDSIDLEYWITNSEVYDTNDTNKTGNKVQSISKTEARTEEGIAIADKAPEKGYAFFNGTTDVYYWQAKCLDGEHKQINEKGVDQTAEGITITHVRYNNNIWQYKTTDGVWHDFNEDDQLVAYYLQKTEVTKEVDTYVKDWGFKTSGTTPKNNPDGQVALTVAVVYPDGTVSPAEEKMYAESTTIFNYWDNRDIGIVAPTNNSDYAISKITVTDGKRDKNTSANEWYNSDRITWDKVTTDAGTTWYNETTVWDESTTAGTTPAVNGKASNVTWSAKNTAKLVLIYLKPVEKETNLNVVYYDDAYNKEITHSQIAMTYTQGEKEPTFEDELKNSGPVKNGSEIELADDAYVTNSSGINQTFNKDITTVPNVTAQYKSGLYKYVKAKISEDGKTLTLHYNIDDTKLDKSYVVDYGMKLEIPLSDLVKDTDVSAVTFGAIENGKADYSKSQRTITYTPSKVLKSVVTLPVRISYTGEKYKTFRVAICPATTVNYEEGFADFTGNWTNKGGKGTGPQNKAVLGEDTNNYGYDAYYGSTAGASDGTEAVSTKLGDKATFEFTGSGVDIFANTTENTGFLTIKITNKSTNSTARMALVNTKVAGDYTAGSKIGYSIPVFSATDLEYGSYKVTITHSMNNSTVNLDGFRVYNTINAIHDNNMYVADHEDNPSFLEVRDLKFGVIDVSNYGIDGRNVYAVGEQVYRDITADTTEAIGAAITVTGQTEYTDQKKLLEDGPKNEVYLAIGSTLTLTFSTQREVQLGLKGVDGVTTYEITDGSAADLKSGSASTLDMFYTIKERTENSETKSITIKNTGDKVLSITKLKVCDDPNALQPISADSITSALYANGFKDPVPMADATANLNLVDYTGKTIASTSLTANGEQGTDASFTADQIKSAVTSALPEGYAVVDASKIADQTVKYGESADVNVQIGKVATLKVTYKKLFGKTVGTATLTGVQTSAGSKYSFSASEIKKAVPSGYWTIKLWGTKVKYGTTGTLTVNVF